MCLLEPLLFYSRPGVFEERAEPEVVVVALHFYFFHVDGVGHAAEGRDGVGAHDLRGDEQVYTVDESCGEQRGVETSAGFGEQGQDAFFAEFVENVGQ
jgi:hypothetical protein